MRRNLPARHLDRGRRLAAPARWRVRVSELLLDPRPHCRGHFRRDRGRRLVVEVDHAARWRDAIRCHSARNASTSASLVDGPKLIRRKLDAMAGSTCIAFKTWLSF